LNPPQGWFIMKLGQPFHHHQETKTAFLKMHEYSITQSLLELALAKANEAKASRITRINLVIGEMSGVVAECVQTYFDLLGLPRMPRGRYRDSIRARMLYGKY